MIMALSSIQFETLRNKVVFFAVSMLKRWCHYIEAEDLNLLSSGAKITLNVKTFIFFIIIFLQLCKSII